MKDKKKYLLFVIIFCFVFTALAIWYVKNKNDRPDHIGQINQTSKFDEGVANQGVLVQFIQPHSGNTDFRTARLLALYVDSEDSPTPFLEPGPFQSVWEGWIEITETAEYRFHFEGTGQLELELDGSAVLQSEERDSETVHLSEGSYLFRAAYSSPDDEPAQMRLLWSTSSFGPETIPSTSLRYDESHGDLQKASLIRHGRYLMAEHYCTSCHQPEDPAYFDRSVMPELKKDAQTLAYSGSNLRAGWLKNWLANPDAAIHSSRLHNWSLDDQQATDIAVFLADIGEPSPSQADDTPAVIQRGGELFAMLGCVACHTLSENPENDERLALKNIADKWYPSSLVNYLKAPGSRNVWTKMPDFHLSDEEAYAIVSFLFDQSSLDSDEQIEGDVGRGRSLVQQMGCVSCHAGPAENELSASSLESLLTSDWQQAFLSENNTSGFPHPELTSEEVESLIAFADQGFESLQRRSPIEFAGRQIESMNCQACHSMDGRQAKLALYSSEIEHLLEDVERNPFGDKIPSLTWIGEQLQPEWLESVLAGTQAHSARPWLDARMPAIGAEPSLFANGLMATHGYGPDYEPVEPDPELVRHGRALSIGIGFLGCDACHHAGQAGGMPAPHLALLAERLRPEFYNWKLQSPRRVDPETAMPEYVNEEGLTWQRERFDGIAEKQFEAIWHYLVENRGNFNLLDDTVAGGPGTPYAEMYQQMDKGPFFSGVVEIPGAGEQPKGLSIRVGDRRQATFHFDHDLLRMGAAWTGDFLEFRSDGDWGIRTSQPPRAAGEIRFLNKVITGWSLQNEFEDTREMPFGPIPESDGRYNGVYIHDNRVVLSYHLYGSDILESPWFEENNQTGAFIRDFQVGPNQQTLSVLLFDGEDGLETDSRGSFEVIRTEQNGRVKIAAVQRQDGIELFISDQQAALRFDPQNNSRTVRVILWKGSADEENEFFALAADHQDPDDINRFTEPGSGLWDPLITTGELGETDGPYAVDIVTFPLENPYDVFFHLTGVDFMDDGRALITTMHGDVWLVDGLDDTLEQITWQRFATGLNMPFGIRVVHGKIYVSNEDELTILHDRNGNGQADYYENFRNLIAPGRGAWRQAFGLEVDAEGNFYFARGRGHRQIEDSNGVFRISPDGKEMERIAVGFRQPWTMGISPSGRVTVTQQEGPWVPQTPVHKIDPETRKGNFYGDMNTYRVEDYPRELGFEPPILWLPRHIDSSAGGQVWVDSDRWGLPKDQMLHLSWGRSSLMQLMHEQVDGDRQGGVVPIVSFSNIRPRTGRFNPVDGQLYVAGFENQGFQRVRYTGKNVNMPVAIRAYENGIWLQFSDPLNPESAGEVSRYTVHRWNYIWQEYYGSHHYSVENPDRFGEDIVPIESVTVLNNGMEVFLEIPEMMPVHQMRITYDIEAADGTSLEESIYNTVHALRPAFTHSGGQASLE